MRAEEIRSTDEVIEFRRPQEAAEPQETAEAVAAHRAAPDTGHETEVPPARVLKAERGIINTGTVHGGQHVTAIRFPGHFGEGADSDG
ncbi:S-type pyocin domain-containing protein [Streptomyces albus subsp. chlorinus]